MVLMGGVLNKKRHPEWCRFCLISFDFFLEDKVNAILKFLLSIKNISKLIQQPFY